MAPLPLEQSMAVACARGVLFFVAYAGLDRRNAVRAATLGDRVREAAKQQGNKLVEQARAQLGHRPVDQVDGDRFRHPARLRRWRPDRTPQSCTIDQLGVDLSRSELLPALTGGPAFAADTAPSKA